MPATGARIQAAVLKFFSRWPTATQNTNMRTQLGLTDYQVLDYGTELAEQLNCYPTRTQILKCNTIEDLIQLLTRTAE
jgi:hypothetical protein